MSVEYHVGAIASRSSVPITRSFAASSLSANTNTGENTGELPTTVSAIGKINFTGNLIPAGWYQHLKLPSGRPDLVGCTILGEIVYPYRLLAVHDEHTGEVLHYVKRFSEDKFCAPVTYFTRRFGLTTCFASNLIGGAA